LKPDSRDFFFKFFLSYSVRAKTVRTVAAAAPAATAPLQVVQGSKNPVSLLVDVIVHAFLRFSVLRLLI
jgi:hypothetical protein